MFDCIRVQLLDIGNSCLHNFGDRFFTDAFYPSIKAFSGDAGYRGTAVEYAKNELGRPLHISEKIEGKWAVLPKRWVVERTFSWLGHFRRLAKDFEVLPATEENMIRIAMLKIALAKCV